MWLLATMETKPHNLPVVPTKMPLLATLTTSKIPEPPTMKLPTPAILETPPLS